MIEPYFLRKRAEYMIHPTEAKLVELEHIQQERRIQTPEKFIQVTILKQTKRTEGET